MDMSTLVENEGAEGVMKRKKFNDTYGLITYYNSCNNRTLSSL